MYKKILVAMALDHGVSPMTLEVARALRAPDGEIIALHVFEAPASYARAVLDEETIQRGYARAGELLREKLRDWPEVKAVLVQGHSYRSIVDHAEANGVDCIVVGSHKPGIGDYLIGSTAARVVRHARCAVHVHRGR